jgi:hypothetical protein
MWFNYTEPWEKINKDKEKLHHLKIFFRWCNFRLYKNSISYDQKTKNLCLKEIEQAIPVPYEQISWFEVINGNCLRIYGNNGEVILHLHRHKFDSIVRELYKQELGTPDIKLSMVADDQGYLVSCQLEKWDQLLCMLQKSPYSWIIDHLKDIITGLVDGVTGSK